MTVSNAPCTAATATYTINVRATPTATAGGSQTICQTTPTATVSGATATNGTILWTVQTGNGTITAGANTLTPTYTVNAADAGTTVTLLMTVSNAPCTAATATYTIIVDPSTPTITPSGTTSFCFGGNVILTASTSASYQWIRNGTDIVGAINQTYTAYTAGSYTVRVNNACGTNTSAATTITVSNPSQAPTSISATATTICNGTSTTLTVVGGSLGTNGTWRWYTDAGFTISAGTGTSIIVSPSASTTYYVRAEDAPPCSANTAAVNVTVTVNPNPTISTTGVINAVCFASYNRNTVLVYAGTTNSPNSYSIDWDAVANTAGLADQAPSAFGFSGGGPSNLSTINVSGNTPTGTYNGVMTITNANGCTATQVVSVTVNPLPTITASAAAASKCYSASAQTSTLAYSATANTPTTYSISWDAAPANSFVAVTNAALGASPITINIPAATAVGIYTGNITVTNANGCVSYSTPFNITINPLPTSAISGSATICPAGSTAISIALTGTQPWSVTYTDGTTPVTVTGITASPYVFNVSPTSTKTYTVTALNDANSCAATSMTGSATVTVSPLPVITTNSVVSRCGAGVVNLTASSAGNTINWYAAASGGGILATGNNYSPTISANTTFYVEAVGPGVCPAPRTAVVATTDAVYVNNASQCLTGNSFQFSIGCLTAGATYIWNFGDGSSYTGQTPPAHVYTQANNYSVQLITRVGNIDSYTSIPISVNPMPVASFVTYVKHW